MNINKNISQNIYMRCFYFVLLCLRLTFSECTQNDLEDFYSKSTLGDGVHELFVLLNGVKVKETAAGPKEGSSRGLVVRQLSNGRQVANLIYNGVPPYLRGEEEIPEGEEEHSPLGPDDEDLELRECKIQKDLAQVDDFNAQFDAKARLLKDVDTLYGMDPLLKLNSSYVSLRDGVSDDEGHLKRITQFRDLKHKCFELHRKIRKLKKAQIRRNKIESLRNTTSTLARRRRGLNELLILPGTKWCGNGRLAKSYADLDGYMVADHCCRDHDLCPSSIPGMSRKFGLYNYRLTTISHCSCDKRFKTCLKQTGTGAADVVGNVFFKIVKSSCFDFKLKRVCKKRGFWSCQKWGYEKRAIIRRPISWNSYTRS